MVINGRILLQGGSGSASNIKFQNIVMHNVENPIIIDQKYCDQSKPCKSQVWKLQLHLWTFKKEKPDIIDPQIHGFLYPNHQLGFISELGCSSAKCVVPEHKRNKFFEGGYIAWLQCEVSMSRDSAARHWYKSWRRKGSQSCMQQCQSDCNGGCVSKLRLRNAWKLGLLVLNPLITHLHIYIFVYMYTVLKNNYEFVIFVYQRIRSNNTRM